MARYLLMYLDPSQHNSARMKANSGSGRLLPRITTSSNRPKLKATLPRSTICIPALVVSLAAMDVAASEIKFNFTATIDYLGHSMGGVLDPSEVFVGQTVTGTIRFNSDAGIWQTAYGTYAGYWQNSSPPTDLVITSKVGGRTFSSADMTPINYAPSTPPITPGEYITVEDNASHIGLKRDAYAFNASSYLQSHQVWLADDSLLPQQPSSAVTGLALPQALDVSLYRTWHEYNFYVVDPDTPNKDSGFSAQITSITRDYSGVAVPEAPSSLGLLSASAAILHCFRRQLVAPRARSSNR